MNKLTIEDGQVYIDGTRLTGVQQLHLDIDARDQPVARVQLVMCVDTRELELEHEAVVKIVQAEPTPRHEPAADPILDLETLIPIVPPPPATPWSSTVAAHKE